MLPPSPFSVSPSYGVRSMSVKACGTSSLGLSRHGTGCLSNLSASRSTYVLEPFLRSLSSQKSAPCGPPLAKDAILSSAQNFSHSVSGQKGYFHHTLVDLGWCYVLWRGSSWIPLMSSPLSPTSLPCALGCDQILPQMFLTVIFELYSEF